PVERWSDRLHDGMEHNIRLVIAKSALGLNSAGADYKTPLRIGSDFGMTYSDEGWGQAMSILTCAANILPHLAEEDRPRAIYQGLRHVATECEGRPPRFVVDPLPTGETRPEVFKKWFRNFIEVRNDEGAERALRTAIEVGLSQSDIADMIFAAATDRIYIDAGHIVDFANKAFEHLDHIGWEHSAQVLTSLALGMATARRSEELNAWRNPIDISSMVWEARRELAELFEQGESKLGEWDGEQELADIILQDDPGATLDAIKSAVRYGASPEQLGSTVAYAAFLRMARFHTSNEFADWDTVHNTLTAANALHQALKRAPSVELARAVLDTAMSVYLDRFLNVPAQRMPTPNGDQVDAEAFGPQLLSQMNVQQQVEQSAQVVSDYLTGAENPEGVLATLGHAMLREDSGFHMFQIVDAGFKQYEERKGTDAGRHVLVALSRFLAAHYPTTRSVDQTFQIAERLNRGDELFRDDGE
ncbi:MAG TPA: nitrite reductase, partial [Dehalococcoidia bacterium]|nr:nitrite reductase [Dehalococcoidia bacterium]